MSSVFLQGVSKTYPGGVHAVQSLDLTVEDGELLVLLGPSGCGKSSTLRLIAGLEEVTTGELRIGGRLVNQVPPKDRDIAMVFQNYALYPHMTVYKNMAFGLQLRFGGGVFNRLWKRLANPAEAARWAVERRGIPGRVRETAQALGIEHLLERMPRQLSGGERQRVALGRAMVRHPAVFLLDEPLSNLDAKLRLETRRELKRLHHQLAATMIYVTHDQTEALTLGQKIAVMHHGKLQQVGTPEEVYREPSNRFVAGFIGSPPMNFIEGELADADGKVTFCTTEFRWDLPTSGRLQATGPTSAIALGIRPEHVELVGETSASEQNRHPRVRLDVRVTLVEPAGETSFVHGKLAAAKDESKNQEVELVCKTTRRELPREGEAAAFEFDLNQTHLFDLETGRNLRSHEASGQA